MLKLQDLNGNTLFEFQDFNSIDFKAWCLQEAFRVGIDKALIFDKRLAPLIEYLTCFSVRENIKEFASAFPDDFDFVICDDDYCSIMSKDLLDYCVEALRLD